VKDCAEAEEESLGGEEALLGVDKPAVSEEKVIEE